MVAADARVAQPAKRSRATASSVLVASTRNRAKGHVHTILDAAAQPSREERQHDAYGHSRGALRR
jgi:hypothetical protein